MRRALFSAILLLLCVPAFAQVNIAWAHGAISQGPVDAKARAARAAAIVGAPDSRTAGASASNFLYVFWFNFFKSKPTTAIPYTCLGDLGMTDQDLHDYDIIAFEGNSRATKGWESSLWFVTDTVHAAAGSFSGDTCDPNKQHQCVNASPSSPLKFKSGTVTKEKFAQCFNLDLANWPEKYLHASWVLIDVPAETGVDVDSKDFRLWVSGAQIGSNRTPDPDAFGVIRHQ